MKRTICVLLTIFMLVIGTVVYAQSVAINNDGSAADASSILDVKSNSKGFLAPRMTATERGNISDPATGLLVYQTDGTAGYYYYNGSVWTQIGAASGSTQWTTSGSDIYYNTGNVGIGSATTNSSKLYIYNDVNGQKGLYVNKTADATSNYPAGYFVNGSGETLREVMLAGNSDYCASFLGGNVGIGTILPGAKLHIEGDGSSVANVAGIIRSTGTTYGPSLRLEATGTNGKTYALYSGQAGDGNAGIFSIYEVGNGDRLAIKNGNVGIGTASPDTRLTVVEDATSPVINVRSLRSNGGGPVRDQTTTILEGSGSNLGANGNVAIKFHHNDYHNLSGDLTFWTKDNSSVQYERMRIAYNGNVGIGTASPSFPLDVNGSASDNPNSIYFNGGGASFQSGTGPFNISIYASNDIMAGGSIVATSDKRVKENIAQLHNSLDLISRLIPVSYNKIDKVQYGDRLHYGFIAQDVEEVIPNAVNTGKGEVPILKPYEKLSFEDGVEYTIIVKNGDDIKEQKYTKGDPTPEGEIFVKSKTVNDFKSLTYDMIFTLAVGAIQEQQQIIEAQQQQIDKLEKLVKKKLKK